MELVYINEENLYLYEDYLDPDSAENIGREFYRCLVACDDDEPRAAVIWELIHLYDDHKPTESRIDWIRIDDPEAGKYILEGYGERVSLDEVETSLFEFESDHISDYIDVFKNAGFKLTAVDGRRMELPLSDFRLLKIARNLKTPAYIKSLSSIKNRTFRRGMVDCVYNVNRDFPADIIKMPVDWYEPDLSSYEETDAESRGFMLIHKCVSGRLRIELLADWGAEPQINMINMIRYSLDQALKNYPDDTKVIIVKRDSATSKLVSYLFPNAPVKKCVKGERSEA